MPSILLVRHGQASYGSSDYDRLSDAGRVQAEAVLRELQRSARPIARIVSGSLLRQRDTAAPVAAGLGLAVEVDPRLDEYDMDDILEAHSLSPVRTNVPDGGVRVSSGEYQRVLEAGMNDWIAAGTGSDARESWPAFAARTRAGLDGVAASLTSGQTALVFTSAGVIAALCVSVLGVAPVTTIALNRVAINASITRVGSGRSGLSLISFNEHAHLEQDPEATVTLR